MRDLSELSRRAVRRAARKVLAATGEEPARTAARPRKRGARTVAEGWEAYAKRRREEPKIGDVWNDPKIMGLDVTDPEDVVGHLDREVFAPFLGEAEVIVEIGPGGGRFTEVLRPKCRTLHAVDTSPTMIDALRERFGEGGGVVSHVGDARGLPLADSSADAVFSYGVFVHLQHWDIYNYLAETARVLKPGGKAIIQHSNTFSPLGWKRFAGEVPKHLTRHKRPETFIVNSPELMAELIRRAGLEPVDMVTQVAARDCIALMRKPA